VALKKFKNERGTEVEFGAELDKVKRVVLSAKLGGNYAEWTLRINWARTLCTLLYQVVFCGAYEILIRRPDWTMRVWNNPKGNIRMDMWGRDVTRTEWEVTRREAGVMRDLLNEVLKDAPNVSDPGAICPDCGRVFPGGKRCTVCEEYSLGHPSGEREGKTWDTLDRMTRKGVGAKLREAREMGYRD
jgi:hypothetical protein